VQGVRRRELRSSDSDWRSGVKFDKEAKNAKEPEHVLRARENLAKYKEKKEMDNPKEKFKSFIARKMDSAKAKIKRRFQVSEAFNMQDVVSRLKGIEASNPEDTVTYGVEDDDGNVMKITVRADQAKKFEQRMAEELATIKTYADSLGTPPFSRYEDEPQKTSTSIAELLFNLRGEFDIVDVEFPEIPSDVIYNADKATYNVKDTLNDEPDMLDSEGEDAGEFGDMGDSGEDFEVDIDGEDDQTEFDGSDGEMPEDEDEINPDDQDSAEDFVEPEMADNSEQSMLQSVLGMLRAEAEARRAGYEKEAEEAKAKQAEYSYKLATHTAAQEEELAQVEAEMERQKEKEKEAKRYADVAKFRVQNTKGAMIAKESVDNIFEIEQVDSVSGLMRMKQGLRDQFQTNPNDSPEDKAFKNSAYIDAMRELDIRIRRAKKTQTYLSRKNKLEQQKQQKEKNEQNQQKRQEVNNPNANQQQTAPGGMQQ
jgi:hypothetical protein